jgi:hypothetical protein
MPHTGRAFSQSPVNITSARACAGSSPAASTGPGLPRAASGCGNRPLAKPVAAAQPIRVLPHHLLPPFAAECGCFASSPHLGSTIGPATHAVGRWSLLPSTITHRSHPFAKGTLAAHSGPQQNRHGFRNTRYSTIRYMMTTAVEGGAGCELTPPRGCLRRPWLDCRMSRKRLP